MYYVYMLRCIDNSIYTGITSNLDRRMEEHFSRSEKCAKYTKRHKVKRLENVWITDDRKLASKLEYHIKTLTKDKKERLVKNNKLLDLYFGEKLESDKYIVSLEGEEWKKD